MLTIATIGRPALARISEQPVPVRGMPPGIDEDQPVRRVEEDRIAVRPAIGLQRAFDQVPGLRRLRGWRGRRSERERGEKQTHDKLPHSPSRAMDS